MAAILLAGALGGALVPRLLTTVGSDAERARRLAARGHREEAVALYVRVLSAQDPPDLDLLMELLMLSSRPTVVIPGEAPPAAVKPPDAAIDEIVARASREPGAAAIVELARRAAGLVNAPVAENEQLVATVTTLADAEPPVFWANRLLAHRATSPDEAARRLDREGLHHPAHASDVGAALEIWKETEQWEEIRKRLADPAYAGLAPASARLDLAVHDRDAAVAVRHLLPAFYEGIEPPELLLGLISASVLLALGLYLGRAADAPRRRLPIYVAAFAAGIVSTWPTLTIGILIDDVLGFQPDGSAGIDLAYFVFAVGLKEELSKLLLALPVMLLLGRDATRLEVLSVGALVGLGFAAEENVKYFGTPMLSVALGRFLTANVLHMTMAAILLLAVHDLRCGRSKPEDLSSTLATVAGLHGAYDFLLSSALFREVSFLAMAIFVLLVRRFIADLSGVRRMGSGLPLLHGFVLCLAFLTSAGFVFASGLVGPLGAASDMGIALVGEALIIYMFWLELPS